MGDLSIHIHVLLLVFVALGATASSVCCVCYGSVASEAHVEDDRGILFLCYYWRCYW